MRLPPARATVAIVVVTALCWIAASVSGQADMIAYMAGFIPARFSGGPGIGGAVPALLTPLSATLVHAGIAHIGFNLLMIGFCGRYVETALGPVGLLLLYVLGAYAAAGAQYLASPDDFSPMIGASGAASALLGTYAILYGRRPAEGRAGLSPGLLNLLWLAVGWIGLQLLFGFAMTGQGNSIAIAAHVGGFIAGLLLARPLLMLRFRRR